MPSENKIIAAVSTPLGNGGISIVRISGNGSIRLAAKAFKGADILKKESHTITFGHIVSPFTGEVLDEVLLTIMKAPKTYTTEDVVEINCHGGIMSCGRVLELILKLGASLAEPGEFTKRAFLGGRIDLTQAEAVIDIINSKTELGRKAALKQLGGSVGNTVRDMRGALLDSIAAIEVSIDYPEHDMEEETYAMLKAKTQNLIEETDRLLDSSRKGRIIREGVSMVILGKPNVGKSSLLNCLLEEERAIVTDIPGTTRDTVEEYLSIGGIAVKIIDTAGIRETDDTVEKIGVEKSRNTAREADVILMLLDASSPLAKEDFEILDFIKGRNAVILLNKCDLKAAFDISAVKEYTGTDNIIPISAKRGEGIGELEKWFRDMIFEGAVDSGGGEAHITNIRHRDALSRARESLKKALGAITDGMPVDFISMDLTDALNILGEITGDSYDGELLDRIFSQFCLGK